MSTFTGILSGHHDLETVVEALRTAGLDVAALPAKGSGWGVMRVSRHENHPFQVYTDEVHFTFKDRLQHPHTLVDIEHRPGTEQAIRALVARFGGWVRETGQYDPEPVRADADVSNPAYDLRIELQECLPEYEYELVRAVARLGREDPEALSRVRGVIDAYLRRLPATADEPSGPAFSPR
jgi:hypothetical protein